MNTTTLMTDIATMIDDGEVSKAETAIKAEIARLSKERSIKMKDMRNDYIHLLDTIQSSPDLDEAVEIMYQMVRDYE